MKKTCRACHENLPVDMFSKGKAVCKPCRNFSMKAYYQEHREEAIARATRWAKQNPQRKQEINKASNLRRHGTRSVQYHTPEDSKVLWAEFLYRHEHASPDERDDLCADFVCTHAAAVITIPTEIEDILAEWEERTVGTKFNA